MSDIRLYAPEIDEGSGTNKIVAAVIVAVAIGAVGIYSYAAGMWNAPPVQTASTRVATNDVPPPPPPMQSNAPTTATPPLASPPDTMAPVQPLPKAPPVRAARAHVRAPAATPSDNSTDVAPPSEMTPAPTPTAPEPQPQTVPDQTPPAQPAPEQPQAQPP